LRERILNNLRIKVPKSKIKYDNSNIDIFKDKKECEVEFFDNDETECEIDKFLSVDFYRNRNFKMQNEKIMIHKDRAKNLLNFANKNIKLNLLNKNKKD